jgi:hypothetical protein
MSTELRAALLAIGFGASACAMMPELPPDWALPMREILLHTTCELQQALRGIDGRTNANQFDARGWTIKVTLNPKVGCRSHSQGAEGRRRTLYELGSR